MSNNKHKKLEEGGVLGVYSSTLDVGRHMFYGLYALQHRGQSSCGIVSNKDKELTEIKGKGLVAEVIEPRLNRLKGNMAVGHVKYGKNIDAGILPLTSIYLKGTLTVSLGGTVSNSEELRERLEDEGAIFQTGEDAEILAHLIARARIKTPSVEEAVLSVMQQVEGAFAAIIMSPGKLMAFRDKEGYRPLSYGEIKDGVVFASEDVAFSAMGAKRIRDVKAGELIMVNAQGVKVFDAQSKLTSHPCVYEYMYFARPDSIIDQKSVYETRITAGKKLFEKCPVEADIVIGVPSAGLHFALGYARASGIAFGDGLIRNYYLGRAADRESHLHADSLDVKLNVVKAAVEGLRVALVDDSLIMGLTAQRLVEKLKAAGAREVHLRIACPRFNSPCPYSPSLSSAALKDKSVEEIRLMCGADSLAFMPKDALNEIGLGECCKRCF